MVTADGQNRTASDKTASDKTVSNRMASDKMASIRAVDYRLGSGLQTVAEVRTIAALRTGAGLREFAAPQRLGFELLIRISSGQTVHEVDGHRFALSAGDVLWVHSGQVQQWGDISAIDGTCVLVPEAALDAEVATALASLEVHARNHWPRFAPDGSPAARAFRGVIEFAAGLAGMDEVAGAGGRLALRQAVGALLLMIAGADGGVGAAGGEVFDGFRTELEHGFRRHRTVEYYAQRLGYSARTLDRAARAAGGISAKALIDRRVMLEAERLLAHAAAPVVEVAEALGFDDAANFSRYFRNRAGLTPGEFRAQHTAAQHGAAQHAAARRGE